MPNKKIDLALQEVRRASGLPVHENNHYSKLFQKKELILKFFRRKNAESFKPGDTVLFNGKTIKSLTGKVLFISDSGEVFVKWSSGAKMLEDPKKLIKTN